MTRRWSDEELARATPAQAKDIRGTAFLKALSEVLGLRIVAGPHSRDPETCSSEVLPALIAEYSMEEFIDPALPDALKRDILKNRWLLQSLEGKDAGVKLGLNLLGADVTITQWHEMEPQGAANTHRIDVMVEDAIWPEEDGRFGARQISAMWRMINRTKRHSQGTELRIGVAANPRAFLGAHVGMQVRAVAPAIVPPPPVVIVMDTRALIPTALLSATARAQA
jgi:phage tail P2-like protein